eukprot:3139102-Prymnesium_polylepis.2
MHEARSQQALPPPRSPPPPSAYVARRRASVHMPTPLAAPKHKNKKQTLFAAVPTPNATVAPELDAAQKRLPSLATWCHSCPTKCVSCVPPRSSLRKYRTTLLRTGNIVTAVVVSRAWDFLFTNYIFTGPGSPLTCDEAILYFGTACAAGGLMLTVLTNYSGRYTQLITIAVGLLVGWAFRSLGERCEDPFLHSSATALGLPEKRYRGPMAIVFAAMITLVAASMIFVLGLAEERLRRLAHRQYGKVLSSVREAGESPLKRRRGGTASTHGHIHKSLLAQERVHWLADMVRRTRALLANALGLGVAATWNLALEPLLSFRAYGRWAASASNVGAHACGHDASLLGDLPDPTVLSMMYAYLLISLCAISNLRLVEVRACNPSTPHAPPLPQP